jgi:hypothetical protein
MSSFFDELVLVQNKLQSIENKISLLEVQRYEFQGEKAKLINSLRDRIASLTPADSSEALRHADDIIYMIIGV